MKLKLTTLIIIIQLIVMKGGEEMEEKRKEDYFHGRGFWRDEYVTYHARIVFVIACVLFVVSVTLCPIFFAQLNREAKNLGDGYLELAEQSSSIEMSLGYLELYKKSVEDNKLNKGTAGFFYKTPDNDMAYRYERLVKGIEFLNMFTGKTELDNRINTLDINMYSMMVDSDNGENQPALRNYISSLSVGITEYLSANSLWWRICDVGSLVTLILSIGLGITVLIMGILVNVLYP